MRRILSFILSKLPPKLSIQLRYYFNFRKFVNFKKPLTFTEKIQWLKLCIRNKQEYTIMVDKYAVKQYVKNIIGEEYIIPTLGVWDHPKLIEWNKLPNKFVLKTTHAGGSNGVVICKDLIRFNKSEAELNLERSLRSDSYAVSKEWPYKNIPRKIIAEELIELPDKQDLTDYKIYCFNGVPKYIQVIQDRNTKETIDFFDTEWKHMEFVGLNRSAKNAAVHPQRPSKLGEMLDIAKKLAKDIVFVRVDLYYTQDKIYFGELTFFPASGMGRFTPDKYDKILGDMIKLPTKI